MPIASAVSIILIITTRITTIPTGACRLAGEATILRTIHIAVGTGGITIPGTVGIILPITAHGIITDTMEDIMVATMAVIIHIIHPITTIHRQGIRGIITTANVEAEHQIPFIAEVV
jgi:hypothetical protein